MRAAAHTAPASLAALALMALALLCGGASASAVPGPASRRLLQEQPLAEQPPLPLLAPEPRGGAGKPLVRAAPAVRCPPRAAAHCALH